MSTNSLLSKMASDSPASPDHLDEVQDSSLSGVSKLAHEAGMLEEKIEILELKINDILDYMGKK